MLPDHSQALPGWTSRQVIQATLSILAVGLGFWLVFRYRMVVLILFAAMILGTAIRPLVQWFERRGLSRGFGLAAGYLIFLGGFSALIFLTVPLLARQAVELSSSLPQIYLELRTVLLKSGSLSLQNIGLNLPSDLQLMLRATPLDGDPLDTVTQFTGIIGAGLTGCAIAAVVLLETSFWIVESERVLRSWLLWVPLRRRQQARELFELVESRVGAYVRGQLILCLAIGLLALIAYLILGLPNALALALIAGIFEAIPILGPALGAIPAILVAFAIEPPLAVWVILSTVIIQGLENYLLVPRVMGAAVGVNPILTLLSLATLSSLLGLPGGLMAIPFAAVIQLLLNRLVLSTDANSLAKQAGRDLTSALRYEVQDLIGDVRKQLRKKGARSNDANDQIEDAIEALAIELDVFLSQVKLEKQK